MTHDELRELVPILALDALEGDDLRALDAHIESCDECISELDAHLAVAASLTADQPPPSHVWDRIVSEIAAPGPDSDVADLSAHREKRRGRWPAVAAAVAALVFGAVAIYQSLRLNELSGPEGVVAAAEDAAAQPGSITADFDTPEGVVAQVVLTEGGEGFVLPADLEPLGDDRTYQLWVITPDEQVISAGVLGNDPTPVRFTWDGEVVGFALTREVAGGVVSSAGDVVSAVEI